MGRQAFTSPSFEAETSEEKVLYWRNAFRSVVFLERSVHSIVFPAVYGSLIFIQLVCIQYGS
jgi:hypothetical protein